jgi:hypothetical protein
MLWSETEFNRLIETEVIREYPTVTAYRLLRLVRHIILATGDDGWIAFVEWTKPRDTTREEAGQ